MISWWPYILEPNIFFLFLQFPCCLFSSIIFWSDNISVTVILYDIKLALPCKVPAGNHISFLVFALCNSHLLYVCCHRKSVFYNVSSHCYLQLWGLFKMFRIKHLHVHVHMHLCNKETAKKVWRQTTGILMEMGKKTLRSRTEAGRRRIRL